MQNQLDKVKILAKKHRVALSENEWEGIFSGISMLTGWDRVRINPLEFAEKAQLNLDKIISFFILGAKTGLFQFEWNLLCPLCGGREHSHDNLNQLDKEIYHCTFCDVDVAVVADDSLEVSFSLNQNIFPSGQDQFASLMDYQTYYFSRNIIWPEPVMQVFQSMVKLRFFKLASGESVNIALFPTPVMFCRVISLETHTIFKAVLGDKPGEGSMRVSLTKTGFSSNEDSIPFTKGNLVIKNETENTMGIIVASPDSMALQKAIARTPPVFKPFVSGKMMLNNQIFRELFLIDNLPDDLSLKINDITLLFTDLKGSTELYDRTGDVSAYKLVQNHFRILENIVQNHHGGIVKTMGDAIMASFNTPIEGVKAGISMIQEMNSFNQQAKDDNHIGLKIGLHRGNVIAVKANQTLDYFGQSVNIAARIQGLAQANEIWLSTDMANDGATREFLGGKYELQSQEVQLKGVGQKMIAHAFRPGG